MITCRYVGGDCSAVGEMEYESIGQRAQFSESQFADVVLGGAPFITEAQFAKVGFSDEELRRYGNGGQRIDVPDDVASKISAAQAAYISLRAEFTGGGPAPATAQDPRITREVSGMTDFEPDHGPGEEDQHLDA